MTPILPYLQAGVTARINRRAGGADKTSTMPIAGLDADTIMIVALVALAGLVALALLQGLGLRRRLDEMTDEDNAAHATLRTAADRLARIEAETIAADQEELRVAVAPALSERLGDLARRNGVSAAAMARTVLDRGAAAVDDEMRRNGAARQAMAPNGTERPFEEPRFEEPAAAAAQATYHANGDAPAYHHANGSASAPPS